MSWTELHPTINAGFNLTTVVLLTIGWIAIRRREVALHRICMVSAFGCSVAFLISYILRYYWTGTHRYSGDGALRIFYFAVLWSHMILAMILVPMVLRSLQLAMTDQFERHKRIARVTFPVWMYVSATGVIVYWMLYR